MGYVGGSLAEIAPEEPLISAARRTADRSADRLLERVKEYTPVAKPPHPEVEGDWLASRPSPGALFRAPGELRRSWRRTDIAFASQQIRFGVDVYTEDPVAPYVEYPTMPHLIRPRKPGGWLRWWDASGMIRFAQVVHHPGTQGTYMLARALADLSIEWQQIGAEEMAEWARETQVMI